MSASVPQPKSQQLQADIEHFIESRRPNIIRKAVLEQALKEKAQSSQNLKRNPMYRKYCTQSCSIPHKAWLNIVCPLMLQVAIVHPGDLPENLW